MFQFSRFALLHYTFSIVGFPIRISADHFLFANPRSFSQLITSFIASESQGIPRVPFLTFLNLIYTLAGYTSSKMSKNVMICRSPSFASFVDSNHLMYSCSKLVYIVIRLIVIMLLSK